MESEGYSSSQKSSIACFIMNIVGEEFSKFSGALIRNFHLSLKRPFLNRKPVISLPSLSTKVIVLPFFLGRLPFSNLLSSFQSFLQLPGATGLASRFSFVNQ